MISASNLPVFMNPYAGGAPVADNNTDKCPRTTHAGRQVILSHNRFFSPTDGAW